MPDITISLTPAQVARVQAALGVSTAAEVAALLRAYLKGRVLDEEQSLARRAADVGVVATIESEGW